MGCAAVWIWRHWPSRAVHWTGSPDWKLGFIHHWFAGWDIVIIALTHRNIRYSLTQRKSTCIAICVRFNIYLPYLGIVIISWKHERQLSFYLMCIFYARASHFYVPDNQFWVCTKWFESWKHVECGMDKNTTTTSFRYRLTSLSSWPIFAHEVWLESWE